MQPQEQERAAEGASRKKDKTAHDANEPSAPAADAEPCWRAKSVSRWNLQ